MKLALPSSIVLSPPGSRLLDVHAELLERWRKAMNLVGPGPIDVHYEDSVKAIAWLPSPTGRWADLGTGAGFPGIVFTALFPDTHVELVDSRQKRCRFLDEAVAVSEWTTASVHCVRHETLEAGSYDGVFSRALHAPERMLEVARRLLKPGGTLVLLLQDEAAVPSADDFEMFHVERYQVDGKRRKSAGLRFRTECSTWNIENSAEDSHRQSVVSPLVYGTSRMFTSKFPQPVLYPSTAMMMDSPALSARVVPDVVWAL